MAGSNPTQRREPSGGARVGVKRRTGGTSKRPSIPVTPTIGARGRAATTTGVGTEDRNKPESGRARQDAARGTVHGQPRSGFKDFPPIDN